jgi:hypothetical protein
MVSKTLVSNPDATAVDMPPADAPIHPAAAILPELSDTEYAALRQNIEQHGVLNPVFVDPETRILDGRHRLRAAHELGIVCRTEVYDGPDPLGFVLSQNLHRRHLTTSQRAMAAAKMANLAEGRPSKNTLQNCRVSTKQAAETFHVGTRTVGCAKIVLKHGSPELIRAVETGEMGVVAAATLAAPATSQSQQLEESALAARTDTDQRTPPASAEQPPQVETGVRTRRGSLRDIVTLVVHVSTLSQACKDRAAVILDPRIAAKLTTVPADERQRWITTVRDARETLSRFERQLLRAFKKAPEVTRTSPAAASGTNGDAPHPDREEHHHG